MSITSPGQYPSATHDGKFIPLDVLRPVGFSFLDIPSKASVSTPLQLDSSILVLYSNVELIISFTIGNATIVEPISGQYYARGIAIPADIASVLSPISDATVVNLFNRSSSSGSVYLNFIESWTVLTNTAQRVRR